MTEQIKWTSANFVELRLECLKLAQNSWPLHPGDMLSPKDVVERAKSYATFVLGVAKSD